MTARKLTFVAFVAFHAAPMAVRVLASFVCMAARHDVAEQDTLQVTAALVFSGPEPTRSATWMTPVAASVKP